MSGVSPLTSAHSGDTSGAGGGRGAGQVEQNICFIPILFLFSEDYKNIGWLFFLGPCNLSSTLYVAGMR